MGGHGMSLIQRGLSALALWRDYRDSNLENADSQIRFHQKLTGLVRAHVNPDPAKAKILEIGCGQEPPKPSCFRQPAPPPSASTGKSPPVTWASKDFSASSGSTVWSGPSSHYAGMFSLTICSSGGLPARPAKIFPRTG